MENVLHNNIFAHPFYYAHAHAHAPAPARARAPACTDSADFRLAPRQVLGLGILKDRREYNYTHNPGQRDTYQASTATHDGLDPHGFALP